MLFFFSQSCQEDNGLMKYDLENLSATIELPDTYKPVNKERLDRILVWKEDDQFKNELLAYLRKKKSFKSLIDTLNPYKFIFIDEKVAYVKIDTNSMYLLIDSERKKSSSRPGVNDSTYFIGSRIDSNSSFKFIESKSNRKSGAKRRFGYTFVISNNTHTSGIAFFSPKEQDARKYVKTIAKKKI